MELKFNVYKGIICDDGIDEPLSKYYNKFLRKWNEKDITFVIGNKSLSGYSIKNLKNFYNKYILLTIYHGKLYPIPDKIYNIKDYSERNNDRKENEIEAEKTYILMDFSKNLVLLPNNRLERNTYEKMINELFEKEKLNLVLKSYVDKNFFDIVKSIKSFKFKSSKPTIFADENSKSLMNVLASDINDFGADDITIKLGYKNNQGPINKIKELYNSILNVDAPVSNEMVTIVGYDQENLEIVFNKGQYNKRISIDTDVDDKLNFNDEEVAEKIIKEVERLNV